MAHSQQLSIVTHLKNLVEKDADRESQQFKETKQTELTEDKSGESLTQKKEQAEPKLLIDSKENSIPKVSIFNNKNQQSAKTNIFANSKSVNLFNLASTPGNFINIFEKAEKKDPLVKDDCQSVSEAEQESKEFSQSADKIDEPTIKEMKYQYKDNLTVLKEFNISKFRVGQSPTKQGIYMILATEKHENCPKMLHLIFQTEGTRIGIHNSHLLIVPRFDSFMNKEENIKFMSLKLKKTDKVEGERQLIKLQFKTKEEAELFKKIISEEFAQ